MTSPAFPTAPPLQPPPLAGKPRSFGRGLLLVVVTLGFYAYYWHYKALRELYDQEKKPEFPTGLFVLGCIPGLMLIGQPLYMSTLLDTLNAAREQRGMPRIFGLGGFLAWYLLGSLIIVGPFIAYSRLQNAINDYWSYEAARRPMQPQTPPPSGALAQPPM